MVSKIATFLHTIMDLSIVIHCQLTVKWFQVLLYKTTNKCFRVLLARKYC